MRQTSFKIVRSFFIVINLIVAALAALFIYVSFNTFNQAYVAILADSQPKLTHTYVSVICGGFGLVVMLLSLLGLFGAIKKSKSVLRAYAAIVFLIVLLLVAMALATYSINPSDPMYREVDKSFVNSTVIVYNYVDSNDLKTRFIDNIQSSFRCCGVNSPNDWIDNSPHKIPKSCCSTPVVSSLPVIEYCAESERDVGCWKALTDYFHANLYLVRAILYVLTGFSLMYVLIAFYMVRALRKNLDVV